MNSSIAEVAVIIPTLGRDMDRLHSVIDAVRSQNSEFTVSVSVVLNTPDDVPWPEDLPGVTVLRPGMNLGWAGGLAYARSVTVADYLWFIQDDMWVLPGCLDALADALRSHPDLGVVSPVVVDDDGNVPPDSSGGWIDPGPPRATERFFPSESSPPAALTGFDDLDYVSSRGMLVRPEAWDAAGGMYPGFYPVQWADIGFCPQLKRAGFGFALVTEAHVRHASHSSTPSAYGHFLFARHRELFWQRHGGEGFGPPRSDPPIPEPVLQTVALGATGVCADLSQAYVAAKDEIVATHEAAAEHAANMQAEMQRSLAHAAALDARLSEVHRRLVRSEARLERAKARTAAMRQSRSWRLTAPLRATRRWLRRSGP